MGKIYDRKCISHDVGLLVFSRDGKVPVLLSRCAHVALARNCGTS